MVPDIWSVTDTIFCHSGPFFALLPSMNAENQKHHKIVILQMCIIDDSHMMYGS